MLRNCSEQVGLLVSSPALRLRILPNGGRGDCSGRCCDMFAEVPPLHFPELRCVDMKMACRDPSIDRAERVEFDIKRYSDCSCTIESWPIHSQPLYESSCFTMNHYGLYNSQSLSQRLCMTARPRRLAAHLDGYSNAAVCGERPEMGKRSDESQKICRHSRGFDHVVVRCADNHGKNRRICWAKADAQRSPRPISARLGEP